MSQDGDFCYSATAEEKDAAFNDYYDDEYGDAVETSLRQLKDEFGETFKEKKGNSLDVVKVVGGKPPQPQAKEESKTTMSTSS